jgi:hypothetical protein
MKIDFFKRLSIKLSLFPALIILFVYIAGGAAFYYSGSPYLFKDSHSIHFANLLSDKKLVIDSWFKSRKRGIGNISKNSVFRNDISKLAGAHAGTSEKETLKGRKTNVENIISETMHEAKQRTSKLLEDIASSLRLKMVAVLSKDGRVISSSRREMIGQNWSGSDFFVRILPELKSSTFLNFRKSGNSDYEIYFLTPVLDANENIVAIIYSVSEVGELASFLKIEKKFHGTEKIELTDREGNVVLTKDGIAAKGVRYNIPRAYKENTLQYKDGLFFNVLSLEHERFRLIGTVEEPAVAKPYATLLVFYASFGGLIIFIMLIQNTYLVPKFITAPVKKLISAIESVSAGNLHMKNSGGCYKGELFELKKAFEAMIAELRVGKIISVKNFKSFNICELLKETEDIARNLVGSKGIELIFECDNAFADKPVYTDRTNLRKVLVALLSSAVKFTNAGTVTVLLSHIRRDKEYIELSVSDTGEGIDLRYINQVFKDFSSDPLYLELAVAKELVDAFGGNMELESIKGKGTNITVAIPITDNGS